MTQADTVRTLRAALQPFAEAWEGALLNADMGHCATFACNELTAKDFRDAYGVYLDTAHAATPQEPRSIGKTGSREQLDALNALCESMLSRKAELDRMIAESRSLIEEYNREAGQ